MKKVIYSAMALVALAVSSSAFAASTDDICAGGDGGSAKKPAFGTAGENFMQSGDFKGKCSRGTFVAGIDGGSGAWYAVGAAAQRGRRTFGGHTNGGGVVDNGACATSGNCAATDATTARGIAATKAGENNS